MKNLENIPERFHVLFTSDWNKGNESEMTSIQRVEMHDLYLEYNRWNIQQAIKPIVKEDEEPNVGFIKD